MKIREILLIVLSASLLASTLYFVLENKKINTKYTALEDEFTAYKKSVQDAKKLALQVQKEAALQAKKEEREKRRMGLKQRVENAAHNVQRLEKKYKHKRDKKWILLEALNQSGVYVKNYSGDRVGDVSVSYLKDGLRAIPLEEIQKVRRRKEGYIIVKDVKSQQVQYIYVKDLPNEHLFIGASLILR